MNREKFGHKYDEAPYPFLWVTFTHHGVRSGPPARAVLDSGADYVVISRGLANFLKLDIKPFDKKLTTAGGIRNGLTAKIDELEICRSNCIFFRNIDVCIVEDDIPILIGRHPFFEDYVVIIDEREKMIECVRQDIYHQKKKR